MCILPQSSINISFRDDRKSPESNGRRQTGHKRDRDQLPATQFHVYSLQYPAPLTLIAPVCRTDCTHNPKEGTVGPLCFIRI